MNSPVETGSEVTLKNSDFFNNSSLINSSLMNNSLASNDGNPTSSSVSRRSEARRSEARRSEARRSSRSESGTVINKVTSKSGSKSSKLNDSKTAFSDIVGQVMDSSDANGHEMGMATSADRVTDIVDDHWSVDGQERSGKRSLKVATLDSKIDTLDSKIDTLRNPLINSNGNHQTDHENCPLVKINVVKVGIYGWRKKFLYILILLITLLVFVNAAFLYWIIKMLNINEDGIGNLKVTSDGIIFLNGKVLVNGDLYASSVKSSKQSGSKGLKIFSPNLVSIHGDGDEEEKEDVKKEEEKEELKEEEREENGRKKRNFESTDEEPILSMDKKSIEVSAESFIIRSGSRDSERGERRIHFLADSNHVLVASDTLRIQNSMAIQLNKSLVTSSLRGLVSSDLILISPTRLINLIGTNGVNLQSSVGRIQLDSLQDVRIESRKGRIILDSGNICLKNVPLIMSKRSSSSLALSTRGRRDEDGEEEEEILEKLKEKERDKEGSSSESPESDQNQNLSVNGTISYQDFGNRTSDDRNVIGGENGLSEHEQVNHAKSGHDKTEEKEKEKKEKEKKEKEKDEIYQLCVCSRNGRIFMVPSDSFCSSSDSDQATICND